MTIGQDGIELCQYRARKAVERLEAARILFESSLWNDSINRSYYAIFTCARSLLSLFGLDSKRHSGVISLFNRHFTKTGHLPKKLSKIVLNAKEGRESSDYADFIEHSKEEAENQLNDAKYFLKTVQELADKLINNELVMELDDLEK